MCVVFEDACVGILKSGEGVITSPNYPNVYPPNQRCIWEIQAPHRIALNFTHFQLEGRDLFGICPHDSVSILSRFSENSKWSRAGTYCGTHLPFVVMPEGNIVQIEFRSDDSVEMRGFLAQYSNFGDIENVDGATDSTDVSFETTTEWLPFWYRTETVWNRTETDWYETDSALYTTETDWYATESALYTTETDWVSSETESIPQSQSPLPHPVSGPVVSTVKPTAGYFDETGSSRSNSSAGSTVSPFSNSQSASETSPVSNTARDPKYLPASPRNYLDISINFPFGQRWPLQDTPLPIDRRPTQNQGMGSVPDYLKSKPSSAQSERGYDIFSVDTQNRDVRKSDEELSSRYADASYSQNNYVPRPLIALFLFSNSYPINIRVNGD